MTKLQESLYWRLWRAACIQQGWEQLSAAEKSEKRHVVHLEALKLDKSHKAFTNGDCDKVFRMLKVLADPDSVGKQMDLQTHLDTPHQGERDRLIYRIKKLADLPYIEAISRDKFDTIRLDDLNLAQLEMLRNTLVNRQQARARREKIDAATGAAPRQAPMDFSSDDTVTIYHLKPHQQQRPCIAGPF